MASIANNESTNRAGPDGDSNGILMLRIEFTGGLEMLFSDQRKHKIDVPKTNASGGAFTVHDLIQFLCEKLLSPKDKMDVFVLDGTVRPGILVLINDADWELEGEGGYELRDGDEVVFVSTLHGG